MGLESDGLQKELEEQFEWFHRHPELALHEYETTAKIKGLLAGIPKVKLLDLGLETGAQAKITGDPKGPVIAVRADIDALPITEQTGLGYASENVGKMHACGHDFHTAALLGTVRILGEEAEELLGTAVFLFQPAEEEAHGGEKVVRTGVFEREKIRQIFGLHVRPGLPVGTIAIASGPFSAAVDRFLIRVIGSGGHGSAPEECLDPIPAARLVGSLQEIVSRKIRPRDAAVVSVTRISSGTSWNIIPEAAELEGTVRSFQRGVRQGIMEHMERYVAGLQAEGYRTEFQWIAGCPATNNDARVIISITLEKLVTSGFHWLCLFFYLFKFRYKEGRMKTKKLTVYEGSGKNYSSIPKIILQGQWLGNLGFSIGDKVVISYQQDKVIIEKDIDGQA